LCFQGVTVTAKHLCRIAATWIDLQIRQRGFCPRLIGEDETA
jgi:hypothetical protein